ncbi:hypothetical protein ACFXPN_19925, partial [Streptomyces griseorubiginosus]
MKSSQRAGGWGPGPARLGDWRAGLAGVAALTTTGVVSTLASPAAAAEAPAHHPAVPRSARL